MWVLLVILWVIMGIVTCGILTYIEDDYDNVATFTFACIVMWPILLVILLGSWTFTKLGKLSIWVAGFIYGFHHHRKRGENE